MNFVRADRLRPTGADSRAALVEFVLTTAFMTTVFSLVRWGIGTLTPAATAAEARFRVVVVSVLVGLVIVGFANSRPGRFSGAHMNPAITLGLFAFGAVPARRVLPYLLAQGVGSMLAALATRLLWGPAVAREPVRWTVVQPGPGCDGSSVAVAEAVTLAVIVAVMIWVTARRPRWPLAWIVGGLFGLQGAVLGTLTGGSANPVRQLGPAIASGEGHLLAVYLVAPMVGALFAGWAARHADLPAGNRSLRSRTSATRSSSSIAVNGSVLRTVSRSRVPSPPGARHHPVVRRYAASRAGVRARWPGSAGRLPTVVTR